MLRCFVGRDSDALCDHVLYTIYVLDTSSPSSIKPSCIKSIIGYTVIFVMEFVKLDKKKNITYLPYNWKKTRINIMNKYTIRLVVSLLKYILFVNRNIQYSCEYTTYRWCINWTHLNRRCKRISFSELAIKGFEQHF